MKVKDAIKLLQTYPKNARIVFIAGYYDDYSPRYATINKIKKVKHTFHDIGRKPYTENVVVLDR